MARPTKPKDLKPKADEAADVPESAGGGAAPSPGPGLDIKFIVTILVILIGSIGGSVGATYFIAPMVVVPAILEKLPQAAEHGEGGEDGAEGEGHGGAHSVGLNLELDEFTVNLKADPNMEGNQFLRTKMSLSISVPAEEDCHNLHTANALTEGEILGAAAPIDNRSGKADGAIVASGGAADPVAVCMEAFKHNMAIYIPTIRDVVNASLMKRTAGSLQTLEGQEALKDEIKDQLNQVLDEKHQVIRVNFADFIIQY